VPPRPARHTLVWLRGDLDARDLVVPRDAAATHALHEWVAQGRPLCVRRPRPDESLAPDEIALGLALPARRRIGTIARCSWIARTALPPLLDAVRNAAPPAWRDSLDRIDAYARQRGAELRTYGSLAWQALSGLGYVTDASDLDVLAYARDAEALDAALTSLHHAQAIAPMRVDGEIVFPGGNAVAWREWSAASARVLVKHVQGVALLPRANLLSAA
jgi:phosphoribosyl-dephospho-CoA transferase